MARNLEFYKGSRKKRNYALIPFVVLLALLVLAVVLFYTVQKYAVISKDGVEVVLPGMEANEGTHIDSQGHEVKTFERVETSLVFDVPDYSHVEATAGRGTNPVRAIYIGSDDLNYDNLLEKAGRLNSGNALLLEMKPRSGVLNWASQSEAALSYGLYYQNTVTDNIAGWVTELKNMEEKAPPPLDGGADQLLRGRHARLPGHQLLPAHRLRRGLYRRHRHLARPL